MQVQSVKTITYLGCPGKRTVKIVCKLLYSYLKGKTFSRTAHTFNIFNIFLNMICTNIA